MVFFIREWPNKTATLMAENGAVLWTFSNVAEAQSVCQEWYRVQKHNVQYHVEGLGQCLDPNGASCSVA